MFSFSDCGWICDERTTDAHPISHPNIPSPHLSTNIAIAVHWKKRGWILVQSSIASASTFPSGVRALGMLID